MITSRDKAEVLERGIDVETVEKQIHQFKEGFPFLNLVRAATVGDGILAFTESDKRAFVEKYDSWDGKRVKFVPASGAATRMFKSLYEAKDSLEKGESLEAVFNANPDVKQVLENVSELAFYPDLKILIEKKTNAPQLSSEWSLAAISLILSDDGLNYGSLPKGLIKFHSYKNSPSRTAAAEHLVEGMKYAVDKAGDIYLHFTVSPDHLDLFKDEIKNASAKLEQNLKVRFHVEFSTQKKSTDTIAVDLENVPFREDSGKLVFRPAGHGALLENLNEIDGDIIFIKNIDNVVPDRLKEATVENKKLLAGILLDVQQKAFSILRRLEKEELTPKLQKEAALLLQFTGMAAAENMPKEEIVKLLNRPIRVCGMVKNQGEPGGGPFFAPDSNGNTSLQIVESSQVNLNDASQKSIFSKSTHFNPVDLACGVKNYKGEKFNLLKYRDPQTGFISRKSKDGRDLKAMELPGLWNGAMSSWLTLFVEVPLITFNPVKTINDLLRNEHQ